MFSDGWIDDFFFILPLKFKAVAIIANADPQFQSPVGLLRNDALE